MEDQEYDITIEGMKEYMRKNAGDVVDDWDLDTLLNYYRQWKYGGTTCGCSCKSGDGC